MDIPVLQDSDFVYRGVVKKYFDATTKKASPFAFFRRPAPNDDDGLSVNHHCLPAECAIDFKKISVFLLYVGPIRQLGLDVIPDEPIHANIVNLPRQEDSPDARFQAECLADDLAKQAEFVVSLVRE